MALGGCLTCIKYLMFVFNFIFWLIGCIILSLGIWVLVDPKSLPDNQVVDKLKILGILFVVLGAVVMIVGFLGCCGAIRESQCMLATFFVFLFLIFAVLVAIGIYAAINPKHVKETVIKEAFDEYKENAEKYNGNSDDEKQKKINLKVNSVHKEFECCGYDKGAADFTPPLPEHCSAHDEMKVHKVCNKAIRENFETFISKYLVIIGGVSLGIAVVLLIGMIFSMMLCCAIRDAM